MKRPLPTFGLSAPEVAVALMGTSGGRAVTRLTPSALLVERLRADTTPIGDLLLARVAGIAASRTTTLVGFTTGRPSRAATPSIGLLPATVRTFTPID